MSFIEILEVITSCFIIIASIGIFIGMIFVIVDSIKNWIDHKKKVKLSDDISLTDEEKAFILRARRHGECLEVSPRFHSEINKTFPVDNAELIRARRLCRHKTLGEKFALVELEKMKRQKYKYISVSISYWLCKSDELKGEEPKCVTYLGKRYLDMLYVVTEAVNDFIRIYGCTCGFSFESVMCWYSDCTVEQIESAEKIIDSPEFEDEI